MKYAIALNDQGRFPPARVGEFVLLPDCNAHIWKGVMAESMKDLAEQMNAAILYLQQCDNPFLSLRVIEVGPDKPRVIPGSGLGSDDEIPTPESVIRSLLQANDELNETIRNIEMRRPKTTLQLLVPRQEEAVTA